MLHWKINNVFILFYFLALLNRTRMDGHTIEVDFYWIPDFSYAISILWFIAFNWSTHLRAELSSNKYTIIWTIFMLVCSVFFLRQTVVNWRPNNAFGVCSRLGQPFRLTISASGLNGLAEGPNWKKLSGQYCEGSRTFWPYTLLAPKNWGQKGLPFWS